MAFFPGEGSEMTQPIGQTVLGGVTFSTTMTLFLMPVLYYIFNHHREKREAKRASKRQKREAKKAAKIAAEEQQFVSRQNSVLQDKVLQDEDEREEFSAQKSFGMEDIDE